MLVYNWCMFLKTPTGMHRSESSLAPEISALWYVREVICSYLIYFNLKIIATSYKF